MGSGRIQSCLVAFGAMIAFGCSGGGQAPPKLGATVELTGIVTLDGKPLEGASIRFAPKSEKGFHGAVGQTDASGKYELHTDIGNGESKDGIVPGDYIVYVSRMVRSDGSLIPADANEPPMMFGGRDTIPLKYSSKKGQISYHVMEKGGTFDIKLDSKP